MVCLVAHDSAGCASVGLRGAVLVELAGELAAADAVQGELRRRSAGHRYEARDARHGPPGK